MKSVSTLDSEKKKKINSAIFILIATIGNLVMIALFAILGLWIFSALFPEGTEAGATGQSMALFGLCFLMPIAVSWFLYGFFIRLLSKKYDLQSHLSPIFFKKRKKDAADRET